MTGTLVNVATILAGTAIGVVVGGRLPPAVHERVLRGLGLVTLVLGVDLALQWRDTNVLFVMGGTLLGGLIGELLGLERRLEVAGDALQRRFAREPGRSTLSAGFFTASLLYCVGALAVVGSFQDGLTGDHTTLYTKAMLDGFASIALAASLGPGVGLAALSVFVYQGGLTLAAGALEPILREGSDALLSMTSAGGVLIVGIGLKLLDVVDVKVGNYLPALVLAPAIAGLASAF